MDIEYFHAWLRQKLHVRSAELRARFSNRLPTARELDKVVSLETLSSDIVNVSEHLFVLFQMLLLIDRIAVNFEPVSHTLFQKVGVDFVPRDASDLVRWLMTETLHGERGERTNAGFRLGHLLLSQSTSSRRIPVSGTRFAR